MRKTRFGILVAGTLITLAIFSAACSSPSSSEAALPESDGAQRSIKVYESPA